MHAVNHSKPVATGVDSRTIYRVGLIGAGIQFSSSPRIHMDEAASIGLNYSYELFDLDEQPNGAAALPGLLDAAQKQGFAGLNITFPCKQSVLPLLDDLSADAATLQSVNTVVFRDGKRYGHNTDWWGFAESFRRGLPDAALGKVVLVGAGGAGSAAAYAASQLGVESLVIHDSNHSRAQQLAMRMAAHFPRGKVWAERDLVAALQTADGAINATPMGMEKLPGMALPSDCIKPPLWVADIVYVPLYTELLELAVSRGCRVLNGGGMAVLQAARAFYLFCGHTPDHTRMLARFDSQVVRAR
jgi:shikimate dehydrogenase